MRFVVINQQAPASVQLAKVNKNRCERVRIPESFTVEDIILRSSCPVCKLSPMRELTSRKLRYNRDAAVHGAMARLTDVAGPAALTDWTAKSVFTRTHSLHFTATRAPSPQIACSPLSPFV